MLRKLQVGVCRKVQYGNDLLLLVLAGRRFTLSDFEFGIE